MSVPTLEEALNKDASTTWYLCGDNFWDEILDKYLRPIEFLPNAHNGSLAFGVGRTGSGIPLHRHGGALLEVPWGRKRWFVAPPSDIKSDDTPPFDPEMSSFTWYHKYHKEYSLGSEERKRGEVNTRLQMCTQNEGDALWLPDDWWHSTLNIGDTVFFLLFT